MSKLFHTERGRPLLNENEEITRWRWARKDLKLPAAAANAPADLWLMLSSYDNADAPLEVLLNGRKAGSVEPSAYTERKFDWVKIPVPRGRLRAGVNQIVLRSDNPAMNAWMLAIESGHRDPASFVSSDRGKTWDNGTLGLHGMLRGEYLIRLRSHAERLSDAKPPAITYEDARHPRVKEVLKLIPEAVRKERDAWKQILALRTFVAGLWPYDNKGPSYSPWDPWTTVAWGNREWCHGKLGRVTMCVHYAAVFVTMAAALGHKARCVVNHPDMHSGFGHFIAEVWDKTHKRWVMHDPNLDIHFEDGGPLSAFELADRMLQSRPVGTAVNGPGVPSSPPMIIDFTKNYGRTGAGFVHTGVWTLNDYVSRPTSNPPSHGSVLYCETDIAWYAPRPMPELDMFPVRIADRGWFDAAPKV